MLATNIQSKTVCNEGWIMSELLVTVGDGIGTITFNRPHALNAITPAVVDLFIDATDRLENDPAVRCVLIRGAGSDFMSGADVKGFYDKLTADRAAHRASMERRVVTGHLAIHRIRRMPKPVIAVVQGACVGFGFSLLCCVDLAIASDDAYFMLAYRHVGLTTDGGASYFLPRIVGERRALEITLLGEKFDSAKALDLGIVNWVVPRDKLDAEALRVAGKFSTAATRAIGGAKRLIRNSLQSSWDEQSAREAEAIAEMVGSDDHLEGVTAFVEKRKPIFTGR